MNATTGCTFQTFSQVWLPGKTLKRYPANLAAGTVVGYRNGIRISYSSVPTVSEPFVICNLSHVTSGVEATARMDETVWRKASGACAARRLPQRLLQGAYRRQHIFHMVGHPNPAPFLAQHALSLIHI